MSTMNNANFTKEMLEILKRMKGKTFKSYKCRKTSPTSFYGKCRLNMGNFSIDLYNYTHEMPYCGFFEIEDIAVFSCEYAEKNSEFIPCEKGAVAHVYMVDEIIKSIEIINDEINVDNGEYEISVDQALVIKTNRGEPGCYTKRF